jgi:hypothetical protein
MVIDQFKAREDRAILWDSEHSLKRKEARNKKNKK